MPLTCGLDLSARHALLSEPVRHDQSQIVEKSIKVAVSVAGQGYRMQGGEISGSASFESQQSGGWGSPQLTLEEQARPHTWLSSLVQPARL